MVLDRTRGNSIATKPEDILYNSFKVLLYESPIHRDPVLDEVIHLIEDECGHSRCPCHDVVLPKW
jgi:hypothetical protein